MGFTNFVLRRIKEQKWSDECDFSENARRAYEAGIDIVDGYRGDPTPLLRAIDQFQTAQSRPYAYAGWAYALMAAAYIRGNRKFDMDGLREAQGWLYEARKIRDGRPEINFIQLMLDLNLEKYEAYLESKELIDPELGESHFHVQFAHLDYCLQTQSLKMAEAQYKKTLSLASTVNQEQMVYRRMTHHFLFAVAGFKALGEVLKTPSKPTVAHYAQKGDYYFSQMAANAQNDPWFWHNYCIFHYHLGNYWKAAEYNKKALAIMQFDAALRMQSELMKKLWILYRFA